LNTCSGAGSAGRVAPNYRTSEKQAGSESGHFSILSEICRKSGSKDSLYNTSIIGTKGKFVAQRLFFVTQHPAIESVFNTGCK
jgi:hypothetical protein